MARPRLFGGLLDQADFDKAADAGFMFTPLQKLLPSLRKRDRVRWSSAEVDIVEDYMVRLLHPSALSSCH